MSKIYSLHQNIYTYLPTTFLKKVRIDESEEKDKFLCFQLVFNLSNLSFSRKSIFEVF